MERESNMRYAAGEASREPDTPTGISIGLGCVVVVAAALVAALVPASAGGVRLGVLAVALAGFAAVAVDPSAAAFVTVTGFLVFDGFLVNRLGQLSWHGADDLHRLELLAVASLLGHGVGTAYRWVVERRRYAPVERWANRGPAAEATPEEADPLAMVDEKGWHGA